jgi:hypothetical protein
MNRQLLALGITAAVLSSSACDIGPCPAIDCADSILIAVKDSAGNAITSYSGTVTLQGRVAVVACGGADAGVLADGGTAVNEAGCNTDGFNVFGGGAQTVTVDLQSAGRTFKGPVTITFKDNQVGPGRCNTSCRSGTGSVTLQ